MVLIDSIKAFDFYKSLPDKVSEKTLYGAIISSLMILFICFSVFSEIYDYYTPTVTSEMYVDNTAKNQDLKIFFNVTLPAIPCALSPLIAGTTIDNADRLLTREIIFYRLNKNGMNIGKYSMEDQSNCKRDYPLQIQNGEGCRIEANLNLLRVPGLISISDFSYNQTFLIPDLVYSHTINELRVGETVSSSIFSHIKYMKTHSNSIKNFEYKTQKNNAHINYQIEIIRIIYTDDLENHQISDEVRYRTTTEENPFASDQGIYFVYSVSPIHIEYMIHNKSVFKFIIRLLILIGGIYTVFGIIDSIVHFVALQISKKSYKEIF